MNKKQRSLYIVSLVLSILWICSIFLSICLAILDGLFIANLPSVYGLIVTIEQLATSEESDWVSGIGTIVTMPVLLPFLVLIFCVTFPPVGFIFAIILGACYTIGFWYAVIAIILLVIVLVFAIAMLIISAKGISKSPKTNKFNVTSRVFAILSLVFLLASASPSIFSVVSLFRIVCTIVVSVLILVASRNNDTDTYRQII